MVTSPKRQMYAKRELMKLIHVHIIKGLVGINNITKGDKLGNLTKQTAV